MAESKENIEAKLAEYLEGTLDAAGCAEIEQHLLRNPEHRDLIMDLRATRSVLRSLPRERAPADLTETLQGQLERTALLGDGLEGSELGSMRINRWPQLFAVAAILLLAVGLGVVVYIVLPSSHPEGFTVIEKQVPPVEGVAAPEAVAVAPSTAGEDAAPDAAAVDLPAVAMAEREATVADGMETEAPAVLAAPMAVAMGESGEGAAGVADRVDETARATGPELVLVLASDDLNDAERRVLDLLRANRLNYERVTDATGQVLVQVPPTSPGAIASEGQAIRGDATDPAGAEAAPAEPEAVAMGEMNAPAGLERRAISRAQRGEAAAPSDDASSASTGLQRTREAAAGGREGYAPRPMAGARSPVSENMAAQQDEAAPATVTQAPQQAAQQVPVRQNQFVVRGLTRRQASELVDSLQRDERTQLAQVYRQSQPAVTNAPPVEQQLLADAIAPGATTAPAAEREADGDAGEAALAATTQPVRAGERLVIEVKELDAPGVEPVTRAHVDAAGRIQLQMLSQPLVAEGLSERELEQAIAERYRDADLIANATARVQREQTPPTTQSADLERVDLMIVLQEPLEAPAPTTRPTTLPAEIEPY